MYSLTVTDHFLNPRNAGGLPEPDLTGHVGSPGEGQFVVLQLAVREGVITEAAFQTFGCGALIAACSLLTDWVKGKRLEAAQALTPGDLVSLLGGLPEDKRYCAELAIGALQSALSA